MFVRSSAKNELRCAAANRHRVDVANDVERDCLSVRRDAEIDPGSFGYVVVDISRRAMLRHDVPLWRYCSRSRRWRASRGRVHRRRGRILAEKRTREPENGENEEV